jgi:ribose transport system substrate-binding protein
MTCRPRNSDPDAKPQRRRLAPPRRVAMIGAALTGLLMMAPVQPALASPVSPPLRIASVIPSTSNTYWQTISEGETAGAKDVGAQKITVQAQGASADDSEQETLLSTMAEENFNCFEISNSASTNLNTPLVALTKRGMPIIAVDTEPLPSSLALDKIKLATYISSDDVQAGKLAGQYLSKLLGGKGTVIVISAQAGLTWEEQRIQGFHEGAPGLTFIQRIDVANGDPATTFSDAAAALLAHPTLSAFLGVDDVQSLATEKAVLDAHRTKVHVVSVDGTLPGLQSVASGDLTATVSQYPWEEGIVAGQACRLAVDGKALPAHITSPVALIDKSNVVLATKDFPRPWFPFTSPIAAELKS